VVSTVRKRTLSNIQIVDRNITLQEVYRKNNGICYLCGEKCDFEDIQIKNGRKICGGNYPSIDHVIPLGAGGAHSWENVRLAHMRCNSIKGTLERADRRKRNDGRQMERTNKTVMS
jgi:5-methylcytosine-specific restriction endonuclease McrA